MGDFTELMVKKLKPDSTTFFWTKTYQTMQEEQPSKEKLFSEIERLRLEVDKLKQEKADLEIVVETITAHGDTVERLLHDSNQQLQSEIAERKRSEATFKFLLVMLLRAKADLEIMLEMTIEHADIVENLLHKESICDPLTSLFNRRYMQTSLEREINRAMENQRSLGIIMIDVDYFKRFNDSFGHEVGDALLQELANLLQRHSRTCDIACRYGGEEFMLILPDTSLETATQQAENLRKQVKLLNIPYLGKTLNGITLSLGVAVFPEHGVTPQTLLKAADAALYCAKAEGRDRVRTAEG